MSTFLFIYGITIGIVLGFFVGNFLWNVFGPFYNKNFSYWKRAQLEVLFFICVCNGVATYKFVRPPMIWWTVITLGTIGTVLGSVYLFTHI
jgi:hypothetical protein